MRNRLSASAGTLRHLGLAEPRDPFRPVLAHERQRHAGRVGSARIFSSFFFSAAMEGGAIG